jgi:hypothetical protein
MTGISRSLSWLKHLEHFQNPPHRAYNYTGIISTRNNLITFVYWYVCLFFIAKYAIIAFLIPVWGLWTGVKYSFKETGTRFAFVLDIKFEIHTDHFLLHTNTHATTTATKEKWKIACLEPFSVKGFLYRSYWTLGSSSFDIQGGWIFLCMGCQINDSIHHIQNRQCVWHTPDLKKKNLDRSKNCKVRQFNPRNDPVKAKFAALCTSHCYRFRNTFLVMLCTSWDDGATAGNSRENRFPEYLAVTLSRCVVCEECQQTFVLQDIFYFLNEPKVAGS